MKIGDHELQEHLRLLAPLFGLIAAVWVLRMVLDFSGAPAMVIHYCSVTAAGAISILLAVLLIYFKNFGGYANVVASAILLEIWEQVLISSAIAFTVFSGSPTIYTAHEYSGRMTPVQHILSHLTFGVGFGSLFGAGMGCLLFWLLRMLVPPESLERHG
jgi:hypothetical protein